MQFKSPQKLCGVMYPARYNILSTHITRSSSKRCHFFDVMPVDVTAMAFLTGVVVAISILTSSVPPYRLPSDTKLKNSILSMTNVMNGAVLVVNFLPTATTSSVVRIVNSIYTSNVLRCHKHLDTDMTNIP